jgi:hypothetical protein
VDLLRKILRIQDLHGLEFDDLIYAPGHDWTRQLTEAWTVEGNDFLRDGRLHRSRCERARTCGGAKREKIWEAVWGIGAIVAPRD